MVASEKPLHIDIPVKLAEVKIAFSVGALQFEGDLPASIFHMQLIDGRYRKMGCQVGGRCGLSHECRPRHAA